MKKCVFGCRHRKEGDEFATRRKRRNFKAKNKVKNGKFSIVTLGKVSNQLLQISKSQNSRKIFFLTDVVVD